MLYQEGGSVYGTVVVWDVTPITVGVEVVVC